MDRVRKQIGAEDTVVLPYTGKGIGVAILDSGISNHPDFQGRMKEFYNFLSKKKGEKNTIVDDFGHGTHV